MVQRNYCQWSRKFYFPVNTATEWPPTLDKRRIENANFWSTSRHCRKFYFFGCATSLEVNETSAIVQQKMQKVTDLSFFLFSYVSFRTRNRSHISQWSRVRILPRLVTAKRMQISWRHHVLRNFITNKEKR